MIRHATHQSQRRNLYGFARTDTRFVHTWMNAGVLMLGALPIHHFERPQSIHCPSLSLLFHVKPLLISASATFQEWHHQLCGPSHTPTGWRDDETGGERAGQRESEREGESIGLGRAHHRQKEKRYTGNDGNKRRNDNETWTWESKIRT